MSLSWIKVEKVLYLPQKFYHVENLLPVFPHLSLLVAATGVQPAFDWTQTRRRFCQADSHCWSCKQKKSTVQFI